LEEVSNVKRIQYFNATTLGYVIVPIKDQVYYVGSFKTIRYAEFRIYPEGYVLSSNYSAKLTLDPGLLMTPLDLENLKLLNKYYFTMDKET
jgi:hypothetical protein